jgi:hypothetical protein
VKRKTLRLIALNLICWTVAGCAGSLTSWGTVAPLRLAGKKSISLDLRTIAQGAVPGGKDKLAHLELVCNGAQRKALAPRLSSPDRPKLQALDLSTGVVIAAFLGLRPTSGHRIDIQSAKVIGSVLEVTVQNTSPTPGESVRQGFESPYHLVQVARGAFDTHPIETYRLQDASGRVLKEGPVDLARTRCRDNEKSY